MTQTQRPTLRKTMSFLFSWECASRVKVLGGIHLRVLVDRERGSSLNKSLKRFRPLRKARKRTSHPTFLLGYEKHHPVLSARPFCFLLGPPRWKIYKMTPPTLAWFRNYKTAGKKIEQLTNQAHSYRTEQRQFLDPKALMSFCSTLASKRLISTRKYNKNLTVRQTKLRSHKRRSRTSPKKPRRRTPKVTVQDGRK